MAGPYHLRIGCGKVEDHAHAPDDAADQAPEVQRAFAAEVVGHGDGRAGNRLAHEDVVHGNGAGEHAQREYKRYGVGAEVVVARGGLGYEGIEQAHAHAAKQAEQDALGADAQVLYQLAIRKGVEDDGDHHQADAAEQQQRDCPWAE